MTTTYTSTLAAAFPVDQSQAIHDAMLSVASPSGERFFTPDTATHIDAEGTHWQYVEAPARPAMVESMTGIADAFPDARLAVVAEVVPLSEAGDRRALWVDRRNGVAMVDTGTRDDVLDGLERIEDVAVNINTATTEELQSLEGVGPSLAQKIIDGRPYDSVDDLTRVSGVSQSMVDGWGDEVVA